MSDHASGIEQGLLRGLNPEQLAAVTLPAQPALILAGADDPITPPADAELIHGRIRGSKLRVIANAAHHLPNEQPAEANAAIEGFLSEL